MRNLKKILALVLALVMSMSLVTIANASDFTDADDITYEEATDVMSAIGVIEGFEDGSFDPNGTLTREQAAKLVTYMMLGDNAEKLGVENSTFKDVAVTRWSAPAIEYCVSLGIIDGAGDGNFYPAGQLTGYAFAKVLLTALGYDSEKEGLTGTAWSVNVAALAMEVGLDEGLENGISSAVLSREEAAQMALNAIKSPLVAYENDVTIVVGDTPVSFGSGDAYYITTTLAREQRISDQQLTNSKEYTVEFGEKYFPNLRLVREDDDFMRPSYTWVYKSEEIGSYVDYDLLEETYTAKVTGRDLYELLSASTIREYDLTYYVDGAEPTTNNISKNELYRNNTSKVGRTGNGVLTQVFVDHDAEEITITSINTYLAKANANYNTKSETISLQVYHNGTGIARIVDVDDVPAIADLKEDDFVLVNWASATDTTSTKAVVKVTAVPEVMTDVEVTRFKKSTTDSASGQGNTDRVTSITTGGEEYKNNVNAYYEDATLGDYYGDLLTNKTYDIYLDQYGYFIGAALHSGNDQYVFIAAYDTHGSAMGIRNADALAIFTDGSMKEITVNTKDTNTNIAAKGDGNYQQWNTAGTGVNRWYTYSVDKDVYTLTPATRYTIEIPTTERTIRTDNLALSNTAPSIGTGRSFGNDDSVYLTVEDNTNVAWGNVIDEVTGMYTGVEDVKLSISAGDWVAAVYDKDNYIIAAIVLGEAEGAVNNYAYILSGANSEGRDGDGNYYWTFDAVLNGEIQEMTIKSKYTSTVMNLRPDTVQELILDGENYVTKINSIPNAAGTTYIKGTNEVFDNQELNAGTAVTDFDVYDVTCSVALSLEGRTLHIDPTYDKNGLFFSRDAKAVVSQSVNGERDEVEYASVQEAYSVLADADNNTANGLTFNGRIVAVLDANGVAQWVFFYDNTNVSSGNQPNYTNGKLDVLGLTFTPGAAGANGTFNVNVATKESWGANGTYTVTIYSGNYVVGTLSTTNGAATAGMSWTSYVNATVGTASGTYRVVVTSNADGVLRTGEATFTINP